MGGLTRILSDTRGAISVLSAFVLIGVIGVSALALEYGHALLQRTENQRVADLAAYGGALVYGSTGSTSSATSAASNIASLNGVSSGVSPTVVTSPTGDGNNAVEVAVTTSVPLLLARVLTTNTTLPVTATTYAEIKSSAPGCIIALSGSGTGVTMDGGTNVNAPNCAVASGNSVTLSGGAALVTQNVDYAKAAPSVSGGASITAPAGDTLHTNKVTTTDPLAPSSGSPGSAEVTSATARISTVASITSPSAPSAPAGTNVTFDSGGKKSTTASSLTTIGCSGAIAASTWTVTCSGSGPFNFGAISISGGVSVTLTNTSSGATYNFSGLIDTGTSNGMTFNGGSNAIYKMAGGVVAHGTAPLSFSAGTFRIGTTSSSPCPAAGYSICVSGSASITFAGPSSFTLAGGIYQDASGKPASPPVALTMGYGTSSNSFNIGKSSDGYSLNEANGATFFGDATGNSDEFQMAGNLTTTGGTCVAVSVAAEHDIDGSLNGAGGIVLGAGIYTINGYVALGNGGGGDVSNCPTTGTTTGLTALNVTLVVSGATTTTCNGVASSAFCLGAGYSTVDLTAPSSGATTNLAVIGPQSSSNTSVAAFTTGATNTRVSGAFYFPNGAVTMSGAAALQDTVDVGACLELIGSQVTLGGGSAAASSCTGLGGTGTLGTTVTLVQ
jgi:Putative Flp pilus-assembly TadE/G-like